MIKNLWIKSSEKCPYSEKHIPDIIDALKRIKMDRIEASCKRKTMAIKGVLASLGGNNGYRIYANQLSESLVKRLKRKKKAKKYNPNKEWLLDLIWCEEDEEYGHEYQLKKIILGMECEWGRKRYTMDDEYGHVKYDFLKLLVTDSELCVMIFRWKRKDVELIAAGKENALSDYFQNAIDGYEGNLNNRILCIGYCNKSESFYFRVYRKQK
jgi:hypothetical protein